MISMCYLCIVINNGVKFVMYMITVIKYYVAVIYWRRTFWKVLGYCSRYRVDNNLQSNN